MNGLKEGTSFSSHTFSLSLSHTLTLSLSLSHTDTHSHTLTHTLSLYLFTCLSQTHTHNTCTHSHSITWAVELSQTWGTIKILRSLCVSFFIQTKQNVDYCLSLSLFIFSFFVSFPLHFSFFNISFFLFIKLIPCNKLFSWTWCGMSPLKQRCPIGFPY